MVWNHQLYFLSMEMRIWFGSSLWRDTQLSVRVNLCNERAAETSQVRDCEGVENSCEVSIFSGKKMVYAQVDL